MAARRRRPGRSRRAVRDLVVERLARRTVARALPDDDVAAAARERQAELGTFGDACPRPGRRPGPSPRAGPARRRGPRHVRRAPRSPAARSRRGAQSAVATPPRPPGTRPSWRSSRPAPRVARAAPRPVAGPGSRRHCRCRAASVRGRGRARSRAVRALPAARRGRGRARSARRAQAGQVDVLVPGEQQPDVVLDRRALRRGQLKTDAAQARVERASRTRSRRSRARGASVGDLRGERSPWERGPISDVHARTPLNRCAVPAPIGVTFPTPPAFQFSPAGRLV